jgi:hypothetical protein
MAVPNAPVRKLSKKERRAMRNLGKLPRARKQMEHSRRLSMVLNWPGFVEKPRRLHWGHRW